MMYSTQNHGFLDFVNRPKFYISKKRSVSATESVTVFV
jgi:hypothetical protein